MLLIDFCSHKAAKFACKTWHYSKSIPAGKLVKIGVWENQQFIGVVIFGRGANRNMLSPYGLKKNEGCELVRVALREHKTPVSRIVAIALKMLKKTNPNLKIVVSYADTVRGHHGGIYQAGNWIYIKKTEQQNMLINGKVMHKKTLYASHGHSAKHKLIEMGYTVGQINKGGKHCYVMPLDKTTRKRIEPLAKSYPKRNACKV